MVNWQEIQQEYEKTKITLAKLAEKHGIPLGTIKSQKSRDTKNGNPWLRDSEKKDATESDKVATFSKEVASKIAEIIQPQENDGLTDKQHLFVAFYVKYWNATKAYRKAYGCAYNTARTEGARLLANPCIRGEIVKVRDALTEDALLDKRTLIQKWIDIAFADMTDYVSFGTQEVTQMDEDGNEATFTVNYTHLSDSNEIDGTLITEVKKGKDGISIKLADRMKAIEYLSKHMDLLNDNERKHLQQVQMQLNIDKTRAEVAELNKSNKPNASVITIVDAWAGDGDE